MAVAAVISKAYDAESTIKSVFIKKYSHVAAWKCSYNGSSHRLDGTVSSAWKFYISYHKAAIRYSGIV